MKTVYGAAAFGLAASAAILPRDQCCFSLTASGGLSGPVSQLDDGQNRIMMGSKSGSGSAAEYCINNGALTDGQGRGCILTAPTTQFQCDMGATPQEGFSVSSEGQLQYNGSSTFYACAATTGEDNIYTETSDAQTKCKEIMLSTGGDCAGYNAAPSVYTSVYAPSPSVYTSVYAPSPSVYTSAYAPSPSVYTSAYTPAPSVYTSVYTPAPSVYTKVYTETASAVTTTSCYTSVYTPAPSVYTSVYTESQSAQTSVYTKTQMGETSVYTESPTGYTSVYTESPTGYTSVYTESPTGYTSVYTSAAQTSSGNNNGNSYAASTPAKSAAQSTYTAATGTQPAKGGASKSACQTNLNGAYQTPHLIVPVSSESPDQSYGTSYNGQVNGTTKSIFNFDIPKSYEGMQCSVIFMLPKKSDLKTSDYSYNGKGEMNFSELDSAASKKTTWNSCPKVKNDYGSMAMEAGNTYVVSTDSCQAGMTQAIMMSGMDGMMMNFFEDYNPAPLGMYITACN